MVDLNDVKPWEQRLCLVEHLQVELRNETKRFLHGFEQPSDMGCSFSTVAAFLVLLECFCQVLEGRSGDFAISSVLHWIKS